MKSNLRVVWFAALVYGIASMVAYAQEAPDFMKNIYPEQGLETALQDMMVLQGEDAALAAKERELIGLGVSAQIPCGYCVYFHTKAAKHHGATDAEIREAIAQAAQVRKWSTMLNGSMYDQSAFQEEVDAMFASQ
jgi:AhpD family alkylhydroperoxidase